MQPKAEGQRPRLGMITARALDAATIKAKRDGRDIWLTDPGPRGHGRFTVRCTRSGARVCMYRYTRQDGSRDILKVAVYDPLGVSGMNLLEARERAGEMSRLAIEGDLRTTLEVRVEAKAKSEVAAHKARARAEQCSLDKLFRIYVQTLEGRQSHYDAKSIFELHVRGPYPGLAARPAAQVKAEELRDVLARLIDAGKGRTAAKLRAYLRAAYGLAMRSGLDPTVPEALTKFEVETNPADRLPSLAQFSRVLDRALTLPELRVFWSRLKSLPESAARDALIACVLLGGQRPTQLLRISARSVDLAGETVTLLDPKGRNRHANPRRHILPIIDELKPTIRRRLSFTQSADSPVFSTAGRVPLRKETLASLVDGIEHAMLVAGELTGGPFSLRDLRRTAETHMAALEISSDVRAQIQSHGLGGIQARHYDRHDYMSEKRQALTKWTQRLQGPPGVVEAARKSTSRPRARLRSDQSR